MKEDEVNNNVETSQNGIHEELKVIQRTPDVLVEETTTFSKFHLSEKLLSSLKKKNFVHPSPIQLKVIPLAKCGLDMIIQAKSGTGKTIAFSICLLESYDHELKYPQSLVIVPTREIAVQIVGVLNEIGQNIKNFKACEFIGGTEIANDRKKIQSTKVIVGTPGRILHLINNEVFNISSLKALVLDEADKLLEGGQLSKDVTSILKMMNSKIQIIAVTATVTSHMEKVLKRTMKNPIGITPKRHEIPVLLGIKQFVTIIPRENDNIALMNAKINELQKIFTRITFKQCLLFTDSQTKTQSYGNYLKKSGWSNEVINGSQDQSHRLDVLKKLNDFKCRILITTDLMARGVDIENVNLIVNLDLPYDCLTYLHRIGRAGRFGTHGIAITFVNGEEELLKYQKLLGDVGGQSLQAMKFPDPTTPYDFWNFEQNDKITLETVAGFSETNGHKYEVNGKETDEKTKENNSNKEEIITNNLALLEITKKLVDKKQECEAFDMNAIIEDYENSFSGSAEITHEKPQSSPEDENIFLTTIKDLNLYDEKPSQELFETPPIVEKRHVIFQRTEFDIEDAEMSEDSSIMSEEESHEEKYDENNSEEESESSDEDQPAPRTEQRMENKSKASHEFDAHKENRRQNQQSYHNYVAAHYSQWENIYDYQLANIQNYLLRCPKFP